ncbi:hypothetical protein [Sorangium sp. So ce887]|uniref:hypothetical protein n=1 Tax=Sorangium sp. So ce887 TaxID=3133324 RepID=UPI003F5DD904
MMDGGQTLRVVSAMLDTRWVFVERGPRLTFEVEANHAKRKIEGKRSRTGLRSAREYA